MKRKILSEIVSEDIQGKILLLDVDGTLVPDKGSDVSPPVLAEVQRIATAARDVFLVSNGPRERTETLAPKLGVRAHVTAHKKPDTALMIGLPEGEYVVIGDKWMTDGRLAQRLSVPFIPVVRLRDSKERVLTTLTYSADEFLWRIQTIASLLRVEQWVKNGLVLAPAFFAGALFVPVTAYHVAIAAISFCVAASMVYIMNDLRDVHIDRQHPIKRFRVIASGVISASVVYGALFFLGILLLLGMTALPVVLPAIIAYLLVNGAYSFGLKHIPVIDVVSVASSHVLRLIAGALAAQVALSPWIVLCTFFAALFLVSAKRRGELARSSRRAVLDYYTKEALDGVVILTVTGALICYSLYAVIGTPLMYAEYSVLFVTVALLRMMVRVVRGEAYAEFPEKLLFKDRVVLVASAGWVVYMAALIYTHTV